MFTATKALIEDILLIVSSLPFTTTSLLSNVTLSTLNFWSNPSVPTKSYVTERAALILFFIVTDKYDGSNI